MKMKTFIINCIFLIIASNAVAQTPNFLWTKTTDWAGGQSVATDPSGNVIVVGTLSGISLIFDTTTLSSELE